MYVFKDQLGSITKKDFVPYSERRRMEQEVLAKLEAENVGAGEGVMSETRGTCARRQGVTKTLLPARKRVATRQSKRSSNGMGGRHRGCGALAKVLRVGGRLSHRQHVPTALTPARGGGRQLSTEQRTWVQEWGPLGTCWRWDRGLQLCSVAVEVGVSWRGVQLALLCAADGVPWLSYGYAPPPRLSG